MILKVCFNLKIQFRRSDSELIHLCFYIEIANVADNLNSLESALDLIEERADRIREQLLELLNSNREIRQSIREENDNKVNEDKPNDKPDADDASPPSDSNQNEPNNP